MPAFSRFLAFLLATSLLAPSVIAQDMEDVEIGVSPVADGVYMLTGQGGNIGLVVTEDGAFLIDDQRTTRTPWILAMPAAAS